MPAIYWYWGGVITDDIITTQMREMRSKGINEFVLFPFNGDDMRPVFGSEDWFDRVGHTLEEARRTGMKVWLFNDNNFPSGRGANLVANGGTLGDRTIPAQPEHRLKGLWRSTAVFEGGSTVALDRSSGVSAEEGRLAVDGQVLDGGAPLAVGKDWSDYTVAGTDVRLTGTSGGIMVRASQDGRSGYLVRIDPKGVLTVTRLDDGAPTLISTGTAVPGFTFQRPRKISVEVRGDTITPYVDGKAQKAAVDSTYPTGTVAPYNTGKDRTLWGDLVVTGADGADVLGLRLRGHLGLRRLRGRPRARPRRRGRRRAPGGSHDADDMVELTPRLDGEGRPTWQAPAGRWQVDLFGSMTLIDDTRGYTRGYLDLLSEDATDAFMNTIPAEYVRRFPWAMGSTVPGFWDDEPFIASAEPHPFKRQPWSPELADEIGALGATPGEAYAASYDELGRDGRELRGTYWRAVNNRFSTAYYKRQAAWMADHGLQLISNPLLDETGPGKRMGNTGDLTKDNQWAQVPGHRHDHRRLPARPADQPGPQRRLRRAPERPGPGGAGDLRQLRLAGGARVHARHRRCARHPRGQLHVPARDVDRRAAGHLRPAVRAAEHVLVRDASDGRLDRPGHGDLARQGRRRHRADPAAAGRRAEPRPRRPGRRSTATSPRPASTSSARRSTSTCSPTAPSPATRRCASMPRSPAGGCSSGRRRTTTRCCPRPRSSTSRPPAGSRTS